MRRRCVLLVLSALTVGLLAPLARAEVAVVGVLTGTADVGQWFVAGSSCDQDGIGDPGGRGVAPAGSTPYSREGSWRLSTMLTTAGVQDGLPGVFDGTIHICGRLNPEPITDQGPFCGASKGFAGQGRAYGFDVLTGEAIDLRLYDFGWKEQAGGILPVIGNFEQRDELGVGTGEFGTAVALVAVSPSATAFEDCVGIGSGDGVQSFEVVAAFVAATGVEKDWNDALGLAFPKTGDDAKSCAHNGPDQKEPEEPPGAYACYPPPE